MLIAGALIATLALPLLGAGATASPVTLGCDCCTSIIVDGHATSDCAALVLLCQKDPKLSFCNLM
ncbi:MAG: hypothetical protein ACYDDF_06805 [Thermoplasmatota archaeon]